MKVLPKRYFSFVVALALTASAFAQQPSTPVIDRLRQKVFYLASDMLDGRRTGTQGANDAAHFIAGEFNLLGLRPGMPVARPARTRAEVRSRYLQAFPYIADVALGNNNQLHIHGHPVNGFDLRPGEEWMPLGFSSNASMRLSQIVFAGYGISSSELKYDDYAVSNVKDRVAIVFAGTPDGDNPHGQFVQAGQIRFKAAAARAAGARALLIIANEENLKEDRLARLSYDNAGEAGLPVIVISRKMASGLLEPYSLTEYQMAADARQVAADSNVKTQPSNSSVVNPPAATALRAVKAHTISLTVNVIRRESPSHNVIGILPGSDPKLKDEAIVIGAHYDHLGRGGQGSLAQREGEIHYGADDNASGTAGLIELARIFSRQTPKPRRTIVFIAFSGEEEGLIGSQYYVNHPVVPLQNTVAMINLDMIGRLNEKKLVIGGVGTASEWRGLIGSANQRMAVSAVIGYAFGSGAPPPKVPAPTPVEWFRLTLNEDGYGPSDHSSFYAKHIPVLFFWTGTHADYHKPSDTAEKINYEGLTWITSFVAKLVRDVDKSDARPTYKVAQVQSTGRSSGFRVYLGTIPNYADSSDGMLLDGVRDDSPAAKAGLKAGDKIVKMAGKDVKNVYDYTYALGEMKAGTEYEVEIVRAGQRMTLKIMPEARK